MSNILIKNGKLDSLGDKHHGEVMDIHIKDGVIAEINRDISDNDALVLDASNYIVSPGLIDVHTHVFPSGSCNGIDADIIGVQRGTTTVIDAGSVGPETFEAFYNDVVLKKSTKVYSFLNISKKGLVELKELNDLNKIDLQLVRDVVAKYPKEIVGLKARASNSVVGDLGLVPIKMATDLSKELQIPIMIHTGNFPPYIEDVLNLMEKGDVLTHAFHGKLGGLMNEKDSVIKEAISARERGVLFDVGHGSASFSFKTFNRARELGFYPDLVSTDLHCENYDGPVYSQHAVITKLINCGESLSEMISKATSVPADHFGLSNLGHLEVGYIADLSISEVIESHEVVVDSMGIPLELNQIFRPVYTVFSNNENTEIITHEL